MKHLDQDIKKVIGGKRYDTKTAKFITSYSNNLGYRDFKHFGEDLYLKKTGEFFLAGEGGPLSKYAKPCPEGVCGSVDIIPLTSDEAKNWVEEYANEFYEDLFLVEEENQRAFSLLIPESLYRSLTIISNFENCTMKDVVISSCENYIEKYKSIIEEYKNKF